MNAMLGSGGPPLLPGVRARYRLGELPQYQKNPLIEALPPIYGEMEVKNLLEYAPPFEEEMRKLPYHIRLHAVAAAADLFVPLPIHYDLEQMISRSLRLSYVNRNPLLPGHWPRTNKAIDELRASLASGNLPHITNSRSFSVFGVSGMGKTTALRRILACYDQVIIHNRYRGRPFTHCQVVWLHLECPRNGSLSVLATDLILELDRLLQTTYYRDFIQRSRNRVENLFTVAANLASKHSLGMLIIDEVQNLVNARGYHPAEMLTFLVELENKFNIPIVMVGTPKAVPLFYGEFRRARRAAGQGDLPWDRMNNDAVWQAFVQQLWRYQFTSTPCELTKPLLDALYFESQGITDLAVKVYLLAQLHAIAEQGSETLTPDRFHKAATTSLKLVQPFLEALRSGNTERLKGFDDIKPIDLAVELEQIKREYTIPAAAQGSSRFSLSLSTPAGSNGVPAPAPSSEAEARDHSKGKKSHRSVQGSAGNRTPDEKDLLVIFERSKQSGVGLSQTLKDVGVVLSTEEFAEGEKA